MCKDVPDNDTSIVSLSSKKEFKKIFLKHWQVLSGDLSQVDK